MNGRFYKWMINRRVRHQVSNSEYTEVDGL